MPFKSKEAKKQYNKLYYQANKQILNEKNKENAKQKREEIKEIKETMKKLLNIL